MIRQCTSHDFESILEVINDAAEAYRGIIPKHCWHEPYMSRHELTSEIKDSIVFWGVEQDKRLNAVMGIQERKDVTLIRHAYVRTRLRNQGIGTKLLAHLEQATEKPILIGTWVDATWAISFYQKHGYKRVSEAQKNILLERYWNVPEPQVEASVVLADKSWAW